MLDYLNFKNFQIQGRRYYTGDFILPKNGRNRNHTHDFFEVITATEGIFMEHNNGMTCRLDKGTVHFIRPSDEHYLTGEMNLNILRNIAFEKSLFEELMSEAAGIQTESFFEPFQLNQSELDVFMQKIRLLDQVNHSEEANLCLIKSIFWDFVLIRRFSEEKREDIPVWLQKCHSEMQKEENYVQGLPRLIALSGKSQPHLTRQLKKYYHVTPSDFINSLRIQKAASMLRLGNTRILDIALECGFENISYFNRVFKEKYGLSPRQYRDMHENFFISSI